MEIRIKYEGLIARCEQLSSFEARGKVDANGESRYLDIHINEVDKQLVLQYIKQARMVIEENILRMIKGSTDGLTETIIKEVAIGTRPIPETRKFYPFETIIKGSSIRDIEGLITDDRLPNGVTIVKRYFLFDAANPRFAALGTDRRYYTNAEVVGENYTLGRGEAKLYEDKDGKRYEWSSRGFYDYVQKEETIYERVEEEVFLVDAGFSWDIRTDSRWNGLNAFTKHVTEAIVSYAMAQWLSGRLDERVAFYESLFASSVAMATKNIFTKQVPRYEE